MKINPESICQRCGQHRLQHNAESQECSDFKGKFTPKNPAAVALGRLGGKPGVKNPRKARSHEQAKAAVMVRWERVKQQQEKTQ